MKCAVAVWARFLAWPHIAIVLCVFAGPCAVAQSGIPCRYEISAIVSGPQCQFSGSPIFARGLSNHNPPWVTGFYADCAIGPDNAFLWTGSGQAQPLQFPGAGIESSTAFDVTDTGLVVGAFAQSGQPFFGFIYDVASGEWTQLNPAVPGGGVVARAANNDGIVVGSRNSAGEGYSAFIYHNGVYTDLGVMNGPFSEGMDIMDDGTVVGWTGSSDSATNSRAFIHSAGVTEVLPPIPGGLSSSAAAINSDKTVVGRGRIFVPGWGNVTHAFYRRSTGQMIDLGTVPGYRSSFAYDVGDNELIIGESRTLSSGTNWSIACAWKDGQAVDLNSLIPPTAGVILHSAWRMNERGEILCEGSHQGSRVAIVLTPVPAPVGDISFDCRVGVPDLLLVINEWGNSKSVADINQDGTVNIVDLMLVIEHWGDDT